MSKNFNFSYFHIQNDFISKNILKILYFCLHIEFFITKKLNSLFSNNELELDIKDYSSLKNVFVFDISQPEKNSRLLRLFDNNLSKPLSSFFNDLSFGEKIFLLKKMKSSYWNKLFIELFSEKKNGFSMSTWNNFFNVVKHWRNNASHTYHNFSGENLINLTPIVKNGKQIEISDFVLHLEKVYSFK
ncbi:MAG: hypothetical protein K2O21_03460, partial [Malacoplasma sp.]|nr:hypothetical protein [Malacoplasma sp.]